jgi:hypothetical protein
MRNPRTIVTTILGLLLCAGAQAYTGTVENFASFEIEVLDLVLQKREAPMDRCLLGGEFSLAEASNGLRVLWEDVTVRIGSYTATIPAGSFRVNGAEYSWHGTIDGAVVGILLEDRGADVYSFAIAIGSFDLGKVSGCASIGLSVGDDAGSVNAPLEGRLALVADGKTRGR